MFKKCKKKCDMGCYPCRCMKCMPYMLGIVGAAVYYIGAAEGFWIGVLGVLKALVWPAFLVYELLMYLGA